MDFVAAAFNTPYCQATAAQSLVVIAPVLVLIGIYALVSYLMHKKED